LFLCLQLCKPLKKQNQTDSAQFYIIRHYFVNICPLRIIDIFYNTSPTLIPSNLLWATCLPNLGSFAYNFAYSLKYRFTQIRLQFHVIRHYSIHICPCNIIVRFSNKCLTLPFSYLWNLFWPNCLPILVKKLFSLSKALRLPFYIWCIFNWYLIYW
jgi:hypothetical protein